MQLYSGSFNYSPRTVSCTTCLAAMWTWNLAGGAVDSDEAFPFQMQNNLLGSFLR
jgi:hypothetical protein